MKIRDNYKLRKIAGENLIIKQGADHSDLTKIISLNPTAVILWEELKDKEFSAEEAADILVKKFEIDKQSALNDVNKFLTKLIEEDIITD